MISCRTGSLPARGYEAEYFQHNYGQNHSHDERDCAEAKQTKSARKNHASLARPNIENPRETLVQEILRVQTQILRHM